MTSSSVVEDGLISSLILTCQAPLPLGNSLFVDITTSASLSTHNPSRPSVQDCPPSGGHGQIQSVTTTFSMTTSPASYPLWTIAGQGVTIIGGRSNNPSLPSPLDDDLVLASADQDQDQASSPPRQKQKQKRRKASNPFLSIFSKFKGGGGGRGSGSGSGRGSGSGSGSGSESGKGSKKKGQGQDSYVSNSSGSDNLDDSTHSTEFFGGGDGASSTSSSMISPPSLTYRYFSVDSTDDSLYQGEIREAAQGGAGADADSDADATRSEGKRVGTYEAGGVRVVCEDDWFDEEGRRLTVLRNCGDVFGDQRDDVEEEVEGGGELELKWRLKMKMKKLKWK